MSKLITQLKQYYTDFLAVDPDCLGELYSQQVIFCDPLHRVEGLAALKDYFASMSARMITCRFQFDDAVVGTDEACLPWQMHYAHPRLNAGQTLSLRGCSLLRFEHRVYYHEDFYDLGAMVYERLPLLGSLVRGVKSRIAGEGPQ
ncbi:nuclear transport factor 2 family protein [Microbulbifer sp. TYP-18]|uniref:nuclear transport factor 2 family protein n=1 Tax=Microbulbifer sp. TYP-18 TaxID=3230024 RepID=UPI0034C6B2E6